MLRTKGPRVNTQHERAGVTTEGPREEMTRQTELAMMGLCLLPVRGTRWGGNQHNGDQPETPT